MDIQIVVFIIIISGLVFIPLSYSTNVAAKFMTSLCDCNKTEFINFDIQESVHAELLLTPASPEASALQLSFPSSTEREISSPRYFVCFRGFEPVPAASTAPNKEQARLTSLFGHVVCRHLGFMTSRSVRPIPIKKLFHDGVWKSKVKTAVINVDCYGDEQDLQQCKWRSIKDEKCATILGINCGDCSHHYENVMEGTIVTPGFSEAYFANVQCEWEITLPKDHVIEVEFQHFFLPSSLGSSIAVHESCPKDGAYLEVMPITHTSQSHNKDPFGETVRLCSAHRLQKLTSSSRQLRLYFSSGHVVHNLRHTYWNTPGIKLRFKGIEINTSRWKIKVIVIVAGSILLVLAVICHYCCKRCKRVFHRQSQNPGNVLVESADNTYVEAYELTELRPIKNHRQVKPKGTGSSTSVSTKKSKTPLPSHRSFGDGYDVGYEIPSSSHKSSKPIYSHKTTTSGSDKTPASRGSGISSTPYYANMKQQHKKSFEMLRHGPLLHQPMQQQSHLMSPRAAVGGHLQQNLRHGGPSTSSLASQTPTYFSIDLPSSINCSTSDYLSCIDRSAAL